MNDRVDVVMHVGSLRRLNGTVYRAGGNFLVVLRTFELFTLTIYVDCKIGVIMYSFRCVRDKANAKDDDRTE
jgi:hypothetical protein